MKSKVLLKVGLGKVRRWTYVGGCLVPASARQITLIGAGRFTFWK